MAGYVMMTLLTEELRRVCCYPYDYYYLEGDVGVL